MVDLELRIRIPEEKWIAGVSREFPDARFEVVSTMMGNDENMGLMEIQSDDILDVLTAMEATESLSEFELLWKRGKKAMVRFRTEEHLVVLTSLWEAGVSLITPAYIRDGEIRWRVTTTPDRRSELREILDGAGIDYTLSRLDASADASGSASLTRRQEEVLRTARDRGYYEQPREVTLDELADAFGISTSTCSGILRRAEATAIDAQLATEVSRPDV